VGLKLFEGRNVPWWISLEKLNQIPLNVPDNDFRFEA